MFYQLFNNPFGFIIWIAALIAAINIHEYAHALAAERLGDPTPRLAGRLTLDPRAHLDPLGTLMLFLVQFGWGKPVPFDPFNLRNPRRDSAIISLAGPTANILLAIMCSLFLTLLKNSAPMIPLSLLSVVQIILEPILILNVSLAVFNLVPIHPLDGFKIVEGILPENAGRQWAQLESLGMIMMIILVFPIFGSSPVLSIISAIVNIIINILLPHARII